MIKSTTLSPPISIHALVKRATEIHGIIKNNEIISIHALVKRATSSFASVIISSNYFNPRPRKEGDVLHPLLNLQPHCISIHALVKRATDFSFATQIISWISIHALVKRATHLLQCLRQPLQYFNPRPRKEGDILKHSFHYRSSSFQSTPS